MKGVLRMHKKLSVALLLVVASNVAIAAEQRPYAFATLGKSSYDGSSDSPIAIRVGGGYNFVELRGVKIGAEGAYIDFGSAKSSSSVPFTTMNASVKTTGLMANAVASYALPNVKGLSLMGKLGMLRASSSGSVNTSTTFFGTTTTASSSFSGTSTGVFFGFGVRYSITSELDVIGTYEDYGTAVSNNGVSKGLTMISAGAAYKF